MALALFRPRSGWGLAWRLGLALLLVLGVAGLILVWSMRVRLATDYIDSEFTRRGVQASYQVRRIGLGTQLFENLVIGDPRRPDATARYVSVQVLVGLTGPRIGLISARGVRMRGRIVDGRLSLGQVDRLLPPPTGEPFRLPDQRIDVDRAAIVLETPAGQMALALSGRGNLADGFAGRLALASRRLRLGDCRLEAPVADLAVGVADAEPSFRGPARATAIACGRRIAIGRAGARLALTLGEDFASWRGRADIGAAQVSLGNSGLQALAGRLSLRGDIRSTQGDLRLGGDAVGFGPVGSGRIRVSGRYALAAERGAIQLAGIATGERLTVDDSELAPIVGALRDLRGTPAGPVAAALATALERAGRMGAGARLGIRLAAMEGRGLVRLTDGWVRSGSGARVELADGAGLGWRWPGGIFLAEGAIMLAGGGLPDTRLALRRGVSGGLEGVINVAPMRAGRSQLIFEPIRVRALAQGVTGFATRLRLDGPFDRGEVSALVVPLRGRLGRGQLALGEGCVHATFRALRYDTLRLGPTRLPLCPAGPALVWRARDGLRAGAELRQPRFSGRLGSSPFAFAAARLQVTDSGIAADQAVMRLGPNRFEAARIAGQFGGGGVAGRHAGVAVRLANVPLLFDEGAGRWRFARGVLRLDGHLRASDAREPVRFHPLVSDDFRLVMAGNRIQAGGSLRHPGSGRQVMIADVAHDLASGAGRAALDVPALAFGGGFQPEQLTPLTVGTVALVEGTVRGRGVIEWGAAGTRSFGSFATEDMNLAAPFGPVEGLATSIRFTDLLGLVSAPGQVVTARLVRAGIDIFDGRLIYQLRPNYRVAIESGRWPLAGGELLLEPTVLDFSQQSTKYLTFRVVGLDAARFIEMMRFANIAATGTFDGVVPMRFGRADDSGRILGGEIIDGRLSARPPGGTLSYVGELTDRDLGPYGILAFNALKSLRYDKFDLTLNGALDGEFITVIDLDGVARDPSLTTLPSGSGVTELIAGRVMRQVSRLPFEFNIRIQGRFRALIATARSFSDPGPLLQAVLPGMLRERREQSPDSRVQDEESEPQR
ncbi:MAG: intermembrane phospholipid transport protein YdbH family protein [Sphingosinicella sp.]